MSLKIFGRNPDGSDLHRLSRSPNYRDAVFQNLSPTPMMSEDSSYLKLFVRLFNKPKDVRPRKTLPSVKTSLTDLSPDENIIVWFGHSSYLLSLRGVTVLVDPVFSGHASPFAASVKSFPGTDVYGPGDMPQVDMLLLTHDHYDHLDYKTLLQLRSKIGIVCTSLGVGAHLRYWGFDPAAIVEFDWWDQKEVLNGLKLTAAPARHFSGRLFARGKTLWSSFVLRTETCNLYLGGDSGYDEHFKEIGEKYGPFDLAILEAGQYNEAWPLIHMMPEQTVQASADLKAKALMPVHWGKFALGFHPWDEPIRRVVNEAGKSAITLCVPRIGEPVTIGGSYPSARWWEANI